jgi:hypothetical protein
MYQINIEKIVTVQVEDVLKDTPITGLPADEVCQKAVESLILPYWRALGS